MNTETTPTNEQVEAVIMAIMADGRKRNSKHIELPGVLNPNVQRRLVNNGLRRLARRGELVVTTDTLNHRDWFSIA